jgi:hypothetical protein
MNPKINRQDNTDNAYSERSIEEADSGLGQLFELMNSLDEVVALMAPYAREAEKLAKSRTSPPKEFCVAMAEISEKTARIIAEISTIAAKTAVYLEINNRITRDALYAKGYRPDDFIQKPSPKDGPIQ